MGNAVRNDAMGQVKGQSQRTGLKIRSLVTKECKKCAVMLTVKGQGQMQRG